MREDIVKYLICPSCGGSNLVLRVRGRRNSEIWRGWLRCEVCSSNYEIDEGIPALEVAPPKKTRTCKKCRRRVEAISRPWPSLFGLKGELVVCPLCGETIEMRKFEELAEGERDHIHKKFVEEDFSGNASIYEWGRLIVPTIIYGFSYQALAKMTARRMMTREGMFLDVATGTGLVAIEMGKISGRSQIIGVDLALEMLKLGRRKAERKGLKNITFVKGDAEELPFKDQVFDGVACQVSLNLFPRPERALAEMWRVMKCQAKLVMSVVCHPPKPNPLMKAFVLVGEKVGHRVRYFSDEEIMKMLEGLFEDISTQWHGAAMLVEARKSE